MSSFNQNQERHINKKKVKEITVVRYHRTVTKRQATHRECSVCGSQELVTVATAAQLTGLSLSTLYRWINSEKIHYIRAIDNTLLLCCQSLLEAIASSST